MNFFLGVQSSARFWSAPAERSGDGAFESLVGEKAKKHQKAGAVQGPKNSDPWLRCVGVGDFC
jgi:hypothetical protein